MRTVVVGPGVLRFLHIKKVMGVKALCHELFCCACRLSRLEEYSSQNANKGDGGVGNGVVHYVILEMSRMVSTRCQLFRLLSSFCRVFDLPAMQLRTILCVPRLLTRVVVLL